MSPSIKIGGGDNDSCVTSVSTDFTDTVSSGIKIIVKINRRSNPYCCGQCWNGICNIIILVT